MNASIDTVFELIENCRTCARFGDYDKSLGLYFQAANVIENHVQSFEKDDAVQTKKWKDLTVSLNGEIAIIQVSIYGEELAVTNFL